MRADWARRVLPAVVEIVGIARIFEGPAHLHIPIGSAHTHGLRLRYHPRVVYWKRKRKPPIWHVRLALLTFAFGSGAARTRAAGAATNKEFIIIPKDSEAL